MRVLLFLSVFGLLFLTGCGKNPEIGIFDSHGKQVASLELDGDGALVKKSGLDIGHVEGDDIFAENGKSVGSVMLEDSRVPSPTPAATPWARWRRKPIASARHRRSWDASVRK